jgi:isoleucyl-tRNA synthetase
MVKKNKTINWKPQSTGVGRFQNWLENINDWNLSRSRFWGIPLPIWRCEKSNEVICVGSVKELREACEKSVQFGHMKKNPLEKFNPKDMGEKNYNLFDLHKHFVDEIVLTSSSGSAMYREREVIDVWFDSGSMPYAQWHYPFENKNLIDSGLFFPADFIAEGVDQTRGWFFTLHAISVMCFNSVAYKNVISNGLVLDSLGQKMSKRIGNTIDPFLVIKKYGPDAIRWYMITNSQPWDNLKFDLSGVVETQQKFFSTIHNIYSFFSLYSNIDSFKYSESEVLLKKRPILDQWILS